MGGPRRKGGISESSKMEGHQSGGKEGTFMITRRAYGVVGRLGYLDENGCPSCAQGRRQLMMIDDDSQRSHVRAIRSTGRHGRLDQSRTPTKKEAFLGSDGPMPVDTRSNRQPRVTKQVLRVVESRDH